VNIPGTFDLSTAHWKWEVYDTTKKKPRWRELRWRMTRFEAEEWARVNGYEVPKTMRQVPGSEESRQPVPMGGILGKLNTK
jgi:hypothetical protein